MEHHDRVRLEEVRSFSAVDRLAVRDEWFPAIIATVRSCSILGVKVEEVTANVLMAFCDDCVTVGFCGNVVMTAAEVIWWVNDWGRFLLQSVGKAWEWWCWWWRWGRGILKMCVSVCFTTPQIIGLRHKWCVGWHHLPAMRTVQDPFISSNLCNDIYIPALTHRDSHIHIVAYNYIQAKKKKKENHFCLSCLN